MENLPENPGASPFRFPVPPRWLLAAWVAAALAAWPVILRERAKTAAARPDDLILSSRLHNSGQYDRAIASARRYLRQVPDSAEAFTNIGISYAALGRWDEAVAATQRAIVLKPGDPLAWNNLLFILSRQLSQHPTPESYQSLAFQSYQDRRYADCTSQAKLALALYPRYTKALNLLSVCELNEGHYDDAVQAARQALALEPRFALARNNLSLALAARNHAPPAPSGAASTDALLESSLRHYRAGDLPGCIADARAALRINPGLASAYNNIAACSNDLGRPDDAISAATEALRLQPDFERARNNLDIARKLKARQSP